MATLIARVALNNALRRANFAKHHPVQLSTYVSRRDFSPLSQSHLAVSNLSGLSVNRLAPATTYCVRFLATGKSPSCKTQTEQNKGVHTDEKPQTGEVARLTLFQRFKQMYRDYWYVLVPVHLITSAGWFGSFYYMAKSGIDVVAIMESYNVSSKLLSPLKDSSLGYVAIAYACYKIATPVRYTVTLGGTTISINYLQKWGYIKPVPTREQLKEMYQNKREYMMDTVKDKREELRLKKEQLKDRTDNLIDDMERKIVTKINDTKKKNTNTIPKS